MKRIAALLLLVSVVRGDEPVVVVPKENYFGAMPKLYARLIKVDPKARTVEAIFDPEGKNPKRMTLPLAWDAEVYRDGGFATLEDFKKDMRVFTMLDVDAKKHWGAVRVLTDEVSADVFRGKRSKVDAWDLKPPTHEKRLAENGLPARFADVDAVKGRAVIVIAREGSEWARTLKPKDIVKLKSGEREPFTGTVIECWPDAARTKIKVVAEGKFLSPFGAGNDVRVLMKQPAKTSPLDALGGDTADERIERIMSTIYCTCGIMGEQCGGKFWTLEACNAMNCGSPKMMKKELAEWMKAGMTDEQIIKKLVDRDGEKVLKPHLD